MRMPQLAAYLFGVSLLNMLVVTPIVIRLGRRWGVLDHPGPRKVHRDPIPLVGGWAIFATLTLVLWGHIGAAWALRGSRLAESLPERIQYFIALAPSLALKTLPVYAGALLIFVLGLMDDLRGLSVRKRLIFQVAIAALLVSLGVRPNLGFFPPWLAGLIGVIWIVGVTNAFNFLDGLDGLSCGVSLVGSLALLTIMGIGDQPDVMFFLAALAGTQLGFLRFNWNPARVFLGSGGSLLLGYLLSVLTIVITFMRGHPDNWLMPLLAPVFVLAIPLYDTASVVLIRLLQNRSISIGDQSHFHHRLMRIGFSHRQTVIFIILIAFSVALSGVRLVSSTLGQSFLILLQIAGIMSLLIIAERVAKKARDELLARRREKNAEPVAEASGRDVEE